MRYHNRIFQLDSLKHLSKLAKLLGTYFDDEAAAWRPQLSAFLDTQPGRVRACSPVDVSDIVEREKERLKATFLASDLKSVALYRTFHPAHAYAQYLSIVRCLSNRRLISRFRSGCHGLHVDTGRFAKNGHRVEKEDRVCHVCHSTAIEDEQHFLLDCPAYSHLRAEHAELFQASPCTVASVINTSNPNLLGRHLRPCHSHGKSVLPSADST